MGQYIDSTPLAESAGQAGAAERDAFERGVCAQWQALTDDGSMQLQVDITTARARKQLASWRPVGQAGVP